MTGPNRLPELPDVPTVAEAGLEISTSGCNGSVHSPPPQLCLRLFERLRRRCARSWPILPCATDSKPWPPDGRPGEEFRLLIDADIKAYSDVVKAANLKFD